MNGQMRAIITMTAIIPIVAMHMITCSAEEATLIFINNSSNVGDVCVYQDDPDMDVQDVMSLAWLAKGAAPTTTLTFTWTIDYCFVWAEAGRLAPGLTFNATQIWEANLETTNKITFKRIHDQIYTFAEQQVGPDEGNLYILGDRTLPVREALVGIGMAGAPIYVVPAQPNSAWIFTPRPHYWITFGTFEPGEVLDVGSIAHKAEIVFPKGVFSMTAILHRDNTWTILPTSDANGL
jgi:hypothetical protein